MQMNNTLETEEKDYYGLKFFLGLLVLVFILAYTSLFAIQNYFSDSFFSFSSTTKKVYMLKSSTLDNLYIQRGMDSENYHKRIEYLEELLEEFGYNSTDVTTKSLKSIPKDSILMVIDMMALSSSEIKEIRKFVEKGGKLLFNFTSGFLSSSLEYQKENLVKTIANLNLNLNSNSVRFNKKSGVFLTTKLLSPIAKYLPEGYAISMPLYDPLPIFHTDKPADSYLTNWTQTHSVQINENKELAHSDSGVIWHGAKGNGKWVYFSFPSYVFTENSEANYKKLFHGMLTFLDRKISVQLYPYIDVKRGVFISEDTEYQYSNISQFDRIVKKHNFPVSAFCVASLALNNKGLMHKVGRDKRVDIGSHSYMHKKIIGKSTKVYRRETIGSKIVLNKFSKEDVIGFRAPREEIDNKLLDLLKEANYKYLLGASENRLYPYFKQGLLIIPRHATDDYRYLINLDWNANQILSEMKKELKTVMNLDGLYSLSTHTHLMTYGSNIKILDKFMSYVQKQKDCPPLNGRMIYDRVSKRLNLHTKQIISDQKMILTIINDNEKEVDNLHYSIIIDPALKITSIESEIIGLKTSLKKQKDGTYLLIVNSLKAKSEIILFIKYAKKS
jgi:peptidoglycan/xylan/chitin deacetylase (PgdA/CDA1 family)